jgi:hypothetical protein
VGAGFCILAAFIPAFHPVLIMVSGALLIATFVHAIVVLVKGNALGGVMLIVGTMLSFILAFCSLAAGVGQTVKEHAQSREKDSARQALVAQPLNLNSQSALLRGPNLVKTVNARVKEIDLQLQALRTATGRPEDIDRRNTLLAERKRLTGE